MHLKKKENQKKKKGRPYIGAKSDRILVSPETKIKIKQITEKNKYPTIKYTMSKIVEFFLKNNL